MVRCLRRGKSLTRRILWRHEKKIRANSSVSTRQVEANQVEVAVEAPVRVLAECPVRVDKDIWYSILVSITKPNIVSISGSKLFCCFSFCFFLLLFLANCSAPPPKTPSPNDWQFPASPLAQSLSACTPLPPCGRS